MNNNGLTKKSLKAAFIVIVALQLMVLGAMIGQRTRLLKNGKQVLLKTEPIDPRSLFSGDYVLLRYEISTLDIKLLQIEKDKKARLRRNDVLYVALEKEQNGIYWHARAVSDDLNKLKKKYPVVIRGKLDQRYFSIYKDTFQVRYGVENYFIPQFEGLEIERKIGAVSVEVAVTASGESGIRKLFIEGKEVKFY
jgi:uncharacterized membrane-anchored protein